MLRLFLTRALLNLFSGGARFLNSGALSATLTDVYSGFYSLSVPLSPSLWLQHVTCIVLTAL